MINGNGLVIPCPNKVIAVVTMTRPIDVATLQSFLGSVGWFRRHISDHAEKQSPLNSLTVGSSHEGACYDHRPLP